MTDQEAEQPIFHMSGRDCSASGRRQGDGFVIFAGATGRSETVPSFETHNYRRLRDELVADGTLIVEGDRIRLTKDYLFGSPSAAAAAISGGNANGLRIWKHDSGRSLGEFEQGVAEQDFRRRWYHAHLQRFRADSANFEHAEGRVDGFRSSAAEALRLLDDLRRTSDVQAFQEEMQTWAVKSETLAFNGFSGQMMINQLVKRSEAPAELARLLADSLTAPSSDEEAQAKLSALTEYVESIRVGAHPAPGHIPFLLSYFWGLADHETWPVLWASAAAYLDFATGDPLPSEPASRYGTYLGRVRELGCDHAEFEMTASWWNQTHPRFLDEVLCDRAQFNRDRGAATQEAMEINARSMISTASYLGNELLEAVSSAVGRNLKVGKPSLNWTDDRPRGDFWVDWTVKDTTGLGVRLWLNRHGVAVAVRPGLQWAGWYEEVAPVLEAADYDGCQVMGGSESRIGVDKDLLGRRGEFVYGRWFDRGELSELDLDETVASVAAQLQPLLDRLVAMAQGSTAIDEPDEDDPLEADVARFLAEQGYPTPSDEDDQADRRRFAELLADDNIALVDLSDLGRIWNTGRYGSPGPMPGLNRSFRDADAADYDRMIDALRHLCWGGDDGGPGDAERIDDLLEKERYRISGLGESVIMKLLAISHPERYLPVYPSSGPKGKRRMLQLLGIDEPTGESRGELQVAANDLLHGRLERFFPGDPWGMAQFLYWFLARSEEAEEIIDPEIDPLDELAEELLVDRAFLDDIVALLEDKGQVVFYGPPGTGKTYLARKLAEVLAPDAARRALVQFHPSSSYEDFFEGYRPEAADDGDMIYRLTPGPLALMAGEASKAPGRRHVMIIDEINRANLPKVLGELLFLLEYRGESVRTLYRPEDAFELPKDLWFVGTMNTADRSIALVDAALRRRFHFIPFFPNEGPMAGLLDRWLAKNNEPEWVGELVAQVNDELAEALGGPHLQLGPSHFMKRNLDEAQLRRIWNYNIEPFIEDQFFGDPQQIDRFRFDAVHARYLEQSGRDEIADEDIDSGPDETGVLLADEPSDPGLTFDE